MEVIWVSAEDDAFHLYYSEVRTRSPSCLHAGTPHGPL